MDRITKSLIEELLKSEEIDSVSESKDFERLVNYSIISNEYSKTFDLNTVTVGDGGDTGIDGVSIIVNGQLIENKEEIDDLIDRNNSLEVTYESSLGATHVGGHKMIIFPKAALQLIKQYFQT